MDNTAIGAASSLALYIFRSLETDQCELSSRRKHESKPRVLFFYHEQNGHIFSPVLGTATLNVLST